MKAIARGNETGPHEALKVIGGKPTVPEAVAHAKVHAALLPIGQHGPAGQSGSREPDDLAPAPSDGIVGVASVRGEEIDETTHCHEQPGKGARV
jgi:hypothetical protein